MFAPLVYVACHSFERVSPVGARNNQSSVSTTVPCSSPDKEVGKLDHLLLSVSVSTWGGRRAVLILVCIWKSYHDYGGKFPEVGCAQSSRRKITSKQASTQPALTFVFHAPLQLHHHGLSRELIQERLRVHRRRHRLPRPSLRCCCYAIRLPPSRITRSQPCSYCLVFNRRYFPTGR